MRDINDTVAAIYTLTLPSEFDRQIYEQIYAEVHALLVDQLMSVSNALAPESEDEVMITNWLQARLIGLANQLPKLKEQTE